MSLERALAAGGLRLGRPARPAANLKSAAAPQVDLRVTPLNAIHGRVYADRNGNGGFRRRGRGCRRGDAAGRPLHAPTSGAYSFYNLWPDTYEVRLHGLPPDFEPAAGRGPSTSLDGAPVTGADFRVLPKEKPVRLGEPVEMIRSDPRAVALVHGRREPPVSRFNRERPRRRGLRRLVPGHQRRRQPHRAAIRYGSRSTRRSCCRPAC